MAKTIFMVWSGYGTKSFEPGGCLGSNPSSTNSLCNLEKCMTSLFSSFNTYKMGILLFVLYMCIDCQQGDVVLDPEYWATFKWRRTDNKIKKGIYNIVYQKVMSSVENNKA